MIATVAIIQARLGSQRFPRKILADLCGEPVLWHVLERACQIRGVDEVIVAVPEDEGDEIREALVDSALMACAPAGVA